MKAVILRSSPRYDDLLAVLGTDTIEVLDPQMRRQVPRTFYQIDVGALSEAQRCRLTRYLSERWKLAGDVVAKLIDDPAHGVPVLASDVVVTPGLFECP